MEPDKLNFFDLSGSLLPDAESVCHELSAAQPADHPTHCERHLQSRPYQYRSCARGGKCNCHESGPVDSGGCGTKRTAVYVSTGRRRSNQQQHVHPPASEWRPCRFLAVAMEFSDIRHPPARDHNRAAGSDAGFACFIRSPSARRGRVHFAGERKYRRRWRISGGRICA